MNKLESLAAFVEVARQGGFSQAARALGTPLSTVSRRVAELEESLGVRLLQRSTRQVALTESGVDYFHSCLRILQDLSAADQNVTGQYHAPQGELSITAPLGFGRQHVQPVALEFLRLYPAIDLRLVLVDRIVNLMDEHIDLALRIAQLPDSSLIARRVGQLAMVVCASPHYLQRHGVPRHPDQLAERDCISWSGLGPFKAWEFTIDGVNRQFPIRTRITTTSPDSAVAAAIEGMGLAQVTTYQAEQAVKNGQLAVVLREFAAASTPVSLVYPGTKGVPVKLRAFLDFAVPRLTERLADIERIAF